MLSIFQHLSVKEFIFSPFISVYALGFLSVGLFTLYQSVKSDDRMSFLAFGEKT